MLFASILPSRLKLSLNIVRSIGGFNYLRTHYSCVAAARGLKPILRGVVARITAFGICAGLLAAASVADPKRA